MPIYEFACGNCRRIFSFYSRRVDTETVPNCPKCGSLLGRQVSMFTAGRSSNGCADPLGIGEDPDYHEGESPEFDLSDERMRSAVEEMGSRIDHLGMGDDPASDARTMREFAEKSGMAFKPGLNDALRAIEAGADPNSVSEKLSEALKDGNPFANRVGGRDDTPVFTKDDTLYELHPLA